MAKRRRYNYKIERDELYCYALTPAPPKWELQEYIAAYLQEKDEQYLSWFLHAYENTLNTNVQRYMTQYFMPHDFADIKQAYVMGLLKALENYDVSTGVPFVVYKERYAEREVLDFIRCARSGYTPQSLNEYAKLRRVMAIWQKYERKYSDEVLEKIADEMQESASTVKEILLAGLLNENAVELYRRYADEDSESTLEEIVSDPSSEPSHIYFREELYGQLWSSFEELDYEERSMLSQLYGFCPKCHSVYYMDTNDPDEEGNPKRKRIPQMMYTDIATEHEYSSANTAKRRCDEALKKLRKAVWCVWRGSNSHPPASEAGPLSY